MASEYSPHTIDPFWYVNHPCVNKAAALYRLSPRILEAIVYVESDGNAYAVSVNRDGKGTSQGVLTYSRAKVVVAQLWDAGKNFDVGVAQINSIHMRQYKLSPVYLLDPCINLHWAAFVLRQKINEHKETWTAVGRYNGSRNIRGYSWKVYHALQRLEKVRQQRR